MIGSFLWLFSHSGALYGCKRDTGLDSVRIHNVAPQLYRALRLLLFAGKHQRRSHPGTPCNIKLIIFCLIKTSSGCGARVYFGEAIYVPFSETRVQLLLQMNISEMDHLALFLPYHLCSRTTKEHWNIEEYTARLYRPSLSSFTHEKAQTMLANHGVSRVRLSSWNRQEQGAFPDQMSTLLKERNLNVG